MIFKNRQAVAEKLTFAMPDFIVLLCIKRTYYFAIKKPTSQSLDFWSNLWGSVHLQLLIFNA